MPIEFNGNEGTFISESTADDYVDDYKNCSWDNGVTAIFYGKNKIQDILDQTDCEGIWVYFGQDTSGTSDKPRLVLIGGKENGDVITGAYILDQGVPCPSYCPSVKLGT